MVGTIFRIKVCMYTPENGIVFITDITISFLFLQSYYLRREVCSLFHFQFKLYFWTYRIIFFKNFSIVFMFGKKKNSSTYLSQDKILDSSSKIISCSRKCITISTTHTEMRDSCVISFFVKCIFNNKSSRI